MKRILLYFGFLCLILQACSGGSIKPSVTGSAGEILLVLDDSLLHSAVGDTLIEILNQDAPGLNQSEPYFNISRVNPNSFTDILKPARNILIIKTGNAYSQPKIATYKDRWARPQAVMVLQAPNSLSAARMAALHEQDILQYFIKAERKRAISFQQHYPEHKSMRKVQEKFGFGITVPSGINRCKENQDFLWMADGSQEISRNLVIYTYPYTHKNTFTREYLLLMRDSVLKANIPGPAEHSYMSTEYRIQPPLCEVSAMPNGSYAMVIRGLWTVVGDLMGGPFVSLTTLDQQNQRIVTVEAFLYAPNKYKRNAMRQLEAVLYTLDFTKSEQNGK